MIKIIGAGRGRGAAAASAATGGSEPTGPGGAPQARRRQPGELRMQKELEELELPSCCTISFPNKDDLMKFDITITPDEGFWKGATYKFTFNVPGGYPHQPPKVKCETKIYHPNIDLQGNICLNLLREDWKPVLAISSVVFGLIHLFLEPNPEDPLNHEAAKLARENKTEFQRQVQRSLRGQNVGSESFPKLL
uniref:UBC core domain-containing protein n=1 Tax=Chromera velia CCMP2878 TaxID=1169474 RepID=A0A0G4HT07_9ALVE|mmetsp:Transcript_54409/g.106462  ORF Transcript_54409/g.106462 Transcript_54409/m.106462 type:complete len:193 (+) Transcript_54409:252-830(+)|eukprot:Cvel_31221.t1-p1 / transcript=Cvel_31221.t1 / gene=Cvel_31221 / organism=Chromera_velia_CCMP2878 / gene_product=NEDD8-conjugating enzyme Ubc12, putative / transcript_product=NEDD8-conjugating enzyme Ubc12, putative / location=Cvel_scaffold4613:1908-4300(+) / protein_length=192 / sequence_SO=supercontig / SO=protein_coding / is_pseudo=false